MSDGLVGGLQRGGCIWLALGGGMAWYSLGKSHLDEMLAPKTLCFIR